MTARKYQYFGEMNGLEYVKFVNGVHASGRA